MTHPPIAILGMACEYAGAHSPEELWENVLAQRCAFRALPPERLDLTDYAQTGDPADSTYLTHAAVIADWTFDRARFRISGSAFRGADIAHWLALDVASRALHDAGFSDARGLDPARTGVIVGNTLTGEMSRAAALRLRWPYVRRVLESELGGLGLPPRRAEAFLSAVEASFKAPFAAPDEDSLAGSLANTIAGRICNFFDLRGGGFSVDGACSSSLLAIAQACDVLARGQLDVVLAGGVDVSLDPFELVGFARTGALARDSMRVYDMHPSGFLPGEGCGFVVLARLDEARVRGARVRALVRGWGISSDGQGGLTRPSAEGQRLALRRAYAGAPYEIGDVAYFEGHGTGTAVGDDAELQALSAEIGARSRRNRALIGSIKTLVGHTKAAAGAAGLIKATLALEHQVLPPTSDTVTPHPRLQKQDASLRVAPEARAWPRDEALRAGVSAMGFGGINVHLTLESATDERRPMSPRDELLARSAQDMEILFLSGAAPDLIARIEPLARSSRRASRAELADLAAGLALRTASGPLRAAIVARDPREAATRLEQLSAWLRAGTTEALEPASNVFLSARQKRPRVALLFTGQGGTPPSDSGALGRRFAGIRELFALGAARAQIESNATAAVQPAIVAASLAGLAALERLGLRGDVAIGHSLGELTAWHWAGAMDARHLLRVVRARGRLFTEHAPAGGKMVSLGCGEAEARELLGGTGAVIAAFNAPRRTIVSGRGADVDQVSERARRRGMSAAELPVGLAFHSPAMLEAARRLRAFLEDVPLSPLECTVSSTVTGEPLNSSADLRALSYEQVLAPVRFLQALTSCPLDLLVEVGPGESLARLASEAVSAPCVALDVGGRSLSGLLQTAALAYVLGAELDPAALFDDRFTRPAAPDHHDRFLANPCESIPRIGARPAPRSPSAPRATAAPSGDDPLLVLRRVLAARLELSETSIGADMRLLEDLHLSSISVAQVVSEAAQQLGRAVPSAGSFARATVGEIALALAGAAERKAADPEHPRPVPAGVEPWIRAYRVAHLGKAAGRARLHHHGCWDVFGTEPGVPDLKESLERSRCGHGVAVCLPVERTPAALEPFLHGLRALERRRDEAPALLLVARGHWGGALARSVHLEMGVPTRVVHVCGTLAGAIDHIVAEARACDSGFHEAFYSAAGDRREPRLEPIWLGGSSRLEPGTVALITGGGKGITAECALELASRWGVELALVGRSDPEGDPELAANLTRYRALARPFHYFRADVADEASCRALVQAVEHRLGKVTLLLHGAGTNTPARLEEIDSSLIAATLAPKVRGLENLLMALEPGRLRTLITFGSIIAQSGLPGEAHYALANEWLRLAAKDARSRHPDCRVVHLDWSVWKETGMGEKLGAVDALERAGVEPLSPRAARIAFAEALQVEGETIELILTGRFGQPATLELGREQLPLSRFVESPLVYYPGVELVADAFLSIDTDPYLGDHVFERGPILPAVVGLEAMAQAAVALGGARPSGFDRVELALPVSVPEAGASIRLASLLRQPDRAEVAIRTGAPDFSQTALTGGVELSATLLTSLGRLALPDIPAIALGPDDLYGPLLFQTGRFRRLQRYLALGARHCLAELAPPHDRAWFSAFLPSQLLLGDPGGRDAAMHAVQACHPGAVLLPVGAARIELSSSTAQVRFVQAREVSQSGDRYFYDLELATQDGTVTERWHGFELRRLKDAPSPHAPALLGPYLQRLVEPVLGRPCPNIAAAETTEPRTLGSDALLSQAAGRALQVCRDAFGRPSFAEGHGSVAHAGGLSIATAGSAALACDLEVVEARTQAVWSDLLGRSELLLPGILAAGAQSPDVARTMLWTTRECLVKYGHPADEPLALHDGWDRGVCFRARNLRIACVSFEHRERTRVLAIALEDT